MGSGSGSGSWAIMDHGSGIWDPRPTTHDPLATGMGWHVARGGPWAMGVVMAWDVGVGVGVTWESAPEGPLLNLAPGPGSGAWAAGFWVRWPVATPGPDRHRGSGIPFEQIKPDYLLWGCFRSNFASSSTPAGCVLQLKHGLDHRAREAQNPAVKKAISTVQLTRYQKLSLAGRGHKTALSEHAPSIDSARSIWLSLIRTFRFR
jgi:hypothetical protein